MGSVANVDDLTFEEMVSGDGVAVVDFWAEWCGPCRVFAPVFESSAERNPDVRHVKVNVDVSPALAQNFGVMSIPTTVVFRNGQPVSSQVGAMNAGTLQSLIDEASA